MSTEFHHEHKRGVPGSRTPRGRLAKRACAPARTPREPAVRPERTPPVLRGPCTTCRAALACADRGPDRTVVRGPPALPCSPKAARSGAGDAIRTRSSPLYKSGAGPNLLHRHACPRCDSNAHCTAPQTVASCRWATRASTRPCSGSSCARIRGSARRSFRYPTVGQRCRLCRAVGSFRTRRILSRCS